MSLSIPSPVPPKALIRYIVERINIYASELLTTWSFQVSTDGFSPTTQHSLYVLLRFMFVHMEELLSSSAEQAVILSDIKDLLQRTDPQLEATDLYYLLSKVERYLLDLGRHYEGTGESAFIPWIHQVFLRLGCELMQSLDDRATNRYMPSTEQWLMRSLLALDDVLLDSTDLCDMITATLHALCSTTQLARCSFFQYMPITQSYVGVAACNLPLSDIRSIHQPVGGVPQIYAMMNHCDPQFIEQARDFLPQEYVHQFQLTSLLLSSIISPKGQPLGIIFMDAGGSVFAPQPFQLHFAKAVIERFGKISSTQLRPDRTLHTRHSSEVLTARETTIVQCIAQGMETRDIAAQLFLSEYTVSDHVRAILRKLDAKTRAQAVAKAYHHGLLS
ncbi:helix-turn-helix transcriptional regulator [Sulfoacidibacillus ferrooxidans]|uniref:HTH luxR-type domain-containing protein n=1 Tax=Sulfoacidibacillus ferrooxidans TaxID=2005001 RepID=A0A9X1VBE0_9BACL|nr:response regulator transcription factor [Sulfoacidibacillus ferrooxidans]MCI0183508.1 hypothetical protein [Sulfoacidibacillus ferrooxidans]